MIILGTNSVKDTEFNVDNSCRFDDDAKLTRTFGSGGSVVKWTWSSWFKVSYIGGNEQVFFSSFTDTSNFSYIKINGNNKLEFRAKTSSSTILRYTLTRRFRDPSAFMHLVVALDTTNGTAGDRIKIWINGVRETVFDASTAPAEDAVTLMNSAAAHAIGYAGDGTDYFQGYMSQVCFVDNVQYDADQFGKFDEDSGIWKAIDVSGLTFGATSFFLDFADSGDLGDDESGNSNDWTEVNLAATDQATDSPTNNFCTLNPLDNESALIAISNGNLDFTSGTGSDETSRGTIGFTKGKWYFESKYTDATTYVDVGVGSASDADIATPRSHMEMVGYYWLQFEDGTANSKAWDNGSGGSNLGASAVNTIHMYAIDMDNNRFWAGKDGTWYSSGNPAANSNPLVTMDNGFETLIPSVCTKNNGAVSINFGNPTYTISSSNADGNDYGNFEYAPPSGFFAICTKNLAEYG